MENHRHDRRSDGIPFDADVVRDIFNRTEGYVEFEWSLLRNVFNGQVTKISYPHLK